MSKVTSKLQVTLPKSMAEKLGIGPGDEIDWEIADDVLRITPTAKRRKATSVPDDRLRWFDQATRRQRQRESKTDQVQVPRNPRDRGWKREELYIRGRKTRLHS